MKKTIYIPDIVCESCVKVIEKSLQQLQGIQSYIIKKDELILEYDPSLITPASIVEVVQHKGYRASLERIAKKTLKERAQEFIHHKTKYVVERKALTYAFSSFIILLGLVFLLSQTMFKESSFLSQYGLWFFYLILSIVALGTAIWHFKSYRTTITCMVGMMVGMTIGMQSGLLIGSILGATNGMFIGSLAGMLIGVIVGVAMGKCCGIMGMLEGSMAGVMGGTMGAMISVMMIPDHLSWFMPPFILINILILLGLSYMIYQEVVEDNGNVKTVHVSFLTFLSYTFLALLFLGSIIIYGPKSIIVGVI